MIPTRIDRPSRPARGRDSALHTRNQAVVYVSRKVYTLFSPFEVDRSRIERIIDPVDPSRDVKDPVASSYGPNPCP